MKKFNRFLSVCVCHNEIGIHDYLKSSWWFRFLAVSKRLLGKNLNGIFCVSQWKHFVSFVHVQQTKWHHLFFFIFWRIFHLTSILSFIRIRLFGFFIHCVCVCGTVEKNELMLREFNEKFFCFCFWNKFVIQLYLIELNQVHREGENTWFDLIFFLFCLSHILDVWIFFFHHILL